MNLKSCFLILLCISPLAMADVEYRGFHIDDHLLNEEQKASFTAQDLSSVQRQVDIVEAVGLPPELLDVLKKVKIIVDPQLKNNPGVFSARAGQGIVSIQPIIFEEDKPILLHELLHAYHYYVLSLKNPAILKAYDAAKHNESYPAAYQRAHFLSNEKEFFAVTGTIYLFGNIHQPPFDCKVLSTSDPAYLDFLEKTFGRHDCG